MDLSYTIGALLGATLTLLGMLVVVTKTLTTWQFYRANSAVGKTEPLTVPYWIRWLVSLLPFIMHQSLFLEDIA